MAARGTGSGSALPSPLRGGESHMTKTGALLEHLRFE
jgi:hypothetical protein